jgi:hypothetical protein
MTTTETPAPAFEVKSFLHRTGRGELKLSVPAPSVFVFEYDGYSDASFIPFIADTWEATFASATFQVQAFADTERQTGYSSDFRTGLMAWSRGMVHQTDVYCLLVKSRWVAIGIEIVRATVGLPAAHAEITSSRATYQQKLEDAIRRSRARPS